MPDIAAPVGSRQRMRWPIAALAAGLAFADVTSRTSVAAQRPDQAALARTIALTRPIPADPDLITRTLANGVRVYVRGNPQPAGRVEFRLVVKAGSVLEEENERGFAHFIEHMAFRGTNNMRPGQMRILLASIGATSTSDSNASTSYDQTVYQLRVPTNRNNIGGAIQILADLAESIAFRAEDVDAERRILLEEVRQRENANTRMFPVLLRGSRYADRNPSGVPSVIQSATPERLRAFYDKWYRPELTAIIAVGDFSVPDVSEQIDARFSTVRSRSAPVRRPTFPMPDHAGTRYAIATDQENTAARVEVHHLLPRRDLTTVDGYRRKILDRLFIGMVTARFAETARKPEAPFGSAGAARGPFLAVRGREDASFTAIVRDNQIEGALGALLDEGRRVARFGFGDGELERQKQVVLRTFERRMTEDRTRDSGTRAADYVRNFTEEDTLPGADLEYALYQRFLPAITVGEVNQLAADWVADDNRIVLVTAPEKDGVLVPDEAALVAAVRASNAREPVRYDAGTSVSVPLLDSLPAPGSIVGTVTHPSLNVTEWRLSNGVTVVVKPTAARADEVVMRAVRLGGASAASDADYPSALAASAIVSGGVGRFDANALERVLTGRVSNVLVSIGEFEEGLAGTASPKDLETFFQLIYLRMTSPRRDEEAFRVARQQQQSNLSGIVSSPDYRFQQTTLRILARDSPRRLLVSIPEPGRWSLDAALAFYRSRFGNASGFTFVFVGNADPEKLRPLVTRYIASLPTSAGPETWHDDGVRPPDGVVERTIAGGIEARSRISLIFNAPYAPSEASRAALSALAGIAGSRLNTALRERLGGAYAVTVRDTVARLPVPLAMMTIGWTCEPGRADELVRAVLSEINRFRTAHVASALLHAQKDLMRRQLDQSNRQNAAIANQIAQKYEYGEDVRELATLPDIYQRLDAAAIQRAAQQYLNPAQFVQVVMVPQAAAR